MTPNEVSNLAQTLQNMEIDEVILPCSVEDNYFTEIYIEFSREVKERVFLFDSQKLTPTKLLVDELISLH